MSTWRTPLSMLTNVSTIFWQKRIWEGVEKVAKLENSGQEEIVEFVNLDTFFPKTIWSRRSASITRGTPSVRGSDRSKFEIERWRNEIPTRLLQAARYVNHTITFFAVFVSRKLRFFRKNRLIFGELQCNSAFSRKAVKISEIFMKICENRDENRILKSKILWLSLEMFAKFEKIRYDENLLKFYEWSGAKEY